MKCEEQRCEQVHSSIGQFVVFEKGAEMNNKYDVKVFSDLIDNFKLEDELKTLSDDLKERMVDERKPVR